MVKNKFLIWTMIETKLTYICFFHYDNDDTKT